MGTLEITTTFFCKNLCNYCPQKVLLQNYKLREHMSLDTFSNCIQKVPKSLTIDFAGFVEPFLNPIASQMIVVACGMNFSVRLFTTLVGLTVADIDILSRCNFKDVVLHLPDNDGDMKATVDSQYIDVAKAFISKIPISSVHAYNSLHHKLTGIFPYCNILSKQILHTRANNISTMSQLPVLKNKIWCDVIKRECGTILDHNVLMPNGDVLLCCMDYGQQHKLGNLLIDTYEDLHRSEGYLYVIEAMQNDALPLLCRTCTEARNIL